MNKNDVTDVSGFWGNTSQNPASPVNKTSKKNRWCFTFNNYSNDEHQFLVQWCTNNTKKFIIGKEIGKQGTPHLQGYFNSKVQYRLTELKKILGDKIHFACCKGTDQKNFDYCSKDGDYISNGFTIPKKVNVINKLRPFQESLKDYILNNIAEGKILWVYDPEGQLGKTEFLRYMYVNHKVPFSYGGKCADIINLVFNNKEYFMNASNGAIIYNFGRDTKPDKISYKSMEQISDGCISNTKFEAGCFVCNKINIVVLANCLPLTNKLTLSRWIVKTINENFELINYTVQVNDLDV